MEVILMSYLVIAVCFAVGGIIVVFLDDDIGNAPVTITLLLVAVVASVVWPLILVSMAVGYFIYRKKEQDAEAVPSQSDLDDDLSGSSDRDGGWPGVLDH